MAYSEIDYLRDQASNSDDEEELRKLEEINEFIILQNNFPEIDFKITCSKGTYIRSIANDFGKYLKTGAFVKHLERYSIGDYDLSRSISINNFKSFG